MSIFSLQFKEADSQQVQLWVEYVRALDFVQVVEEKKENPYLSIDEIRHQYPDCWVLLAEAQTEGVRVLGGRVIFTAADKRVLALQGRDLVKQYTGVRHFYTGDIPHHKHIGIIVRRKKGSE